MIHVVDISSLSSCHMCNNKLVVFPVVKLIDCN
jgi:hypothetical protein